MTITQVLNKVRLAIQELLIRPILRRTPKYNKKYKISVCGIFKDEGPFLKEWIEFNKMVGVEHFYLYNNNSSDNFLNVLAPYIESGLVTYIDFPYNQAQIAVMTYFKSTKFLGLIDLVEELANSYVALDKHNLIFDEDFEVDLEVDLD